MGSIRGLVGRHVWVLMAVLISAVLVGVPATNAPRLRVVLPEHEAHIVEFSPDSRLMLTDGASGGCVRDAVTGRVLVRLMRAGANGPIPATGITWPRFTADGRYLIVQLGGPRFGQEVTVTLVVFDVATGRECALFDRVGSGIWWGSALAPAEYTLSADGSTLAFSQSAGTRTVQWDGRITLRRTGRVLVWDVATEKVVAEFPGLSPLALTSDGSKLAYYDDTDSPTTAPTIRALKLKSERPATTRVRGISALTAQGAGPIAFSPDGRLLAAKVEDRSQMVRFFSDRSEVVELRDVSGGQVRAALDPNLPRHNAWFSPGHIRFSPDARSLILEDIGGYTNPERIQCWDLSGASPRRGAQTLSEGFSPDGSRTVIAEYNMASRWDPVSQYSAVEVFDQHATKARFRLVEPGIVHKAAISPDGRIMALPLSRVERDESRWARLFLSLIRRSLGDPRSAFGDLALPRINFHEIKLRDASTGRLLGTIDRSARGRPPHLMTFSPDGKTLVAKYLPVDFKGWNSQNPMINWSVELWDIPAGLLSSGMDSLAPALLAASLVFAGAWLDRRRGLAVGSRQYEAMFSASLRPRRSA
jgi:WD40 repeat protein